MPFEKLPDNLGMIYVPDSKAKNWKNPCPDCFSFQWCVNERCPSCKGNFPKTYKILHIQPK